MARGEISDPLLPLNTGVHLFVDNYYIENSSSLQFQNGKIEKDLDHPLVHPEYPWENAVHFYTSFLQVPADLSIHGKAMYLLYYACAASYQVLFNSTVSVCVANSTDGINWQKPLLWYYPFTANGTQSARPTNIVFVTETNEFLGSIFLDRGKRTPRLEIFKMTYENSPQRFVYIGTSPDGFKWTAGTKPAHPKAGLSDTQTVMLYSGNNGGEYVLYGRYNSDVANTSVYCPGSWSDYRHAVVTLSTESAFGPWTESVEAFPLGSPDPIQCFDNYNPAALFYNNVYFLFPSGYLHWAQSDSGAPIQRAAQNDGVMDIRLAVSHLAHGPFTFPTRDPFISRGIGTVDPKSKLVNGTGSDRDAGFVFSSANGLLDPDFIRSDVVTPSAWMYHVYWGSQTTHAGGGAFLGRYWPDAYSGIFRARLRREGYVSLATLTSDPTGKGWFTSKVLSLPEKKDGQQLLLYINAEIATAGYLAIQFEDGLTGNPIPGFTFDECKTLHGNGIRQLLEWKTQNGTYSADLTPLVNYPNGVRFHVHVGHTKLYAFILSYV
ncbi:unnamed protein product [Adineta ricciae]|uniref:Uncharacterized protein n=1 Tax=Adineta ricciae TaxID=249248 RepID=A0A815R839_ADIRI|nr:unnamed protein product [Adineta ricciae]CAF1473467.1 unnamed protein product [Adineta ricciae]